MANKQVTVAGVRFTDTTLCNVAVDLLAETSAKFLYNHCIRAYVFGSLIDQAQSNGYDSDVEWLRRQGIADVESAH